MLGFCNDQSARPLEPELQETFGNMRQADACVGPCLSSDVPILAHVLRVPRSSRQTPTCVHKETSKLERAQGNFSKDFKNKVTRWWSAHCCFAELPTLCDAPPLPQAVWPTWYGAHCRGSARHRRRSPEPLELLHACRNKLDVIRLRRIELWLFAARLALQFGLMVLLVLVIMSGHGHS